MMFGFIVTVDDDCEQDWLLCQEDILVAVQKALDERFIFNTIDVEPAEVQS